MSNSSEQQEDFEVVPPPIDWDDDGWDDDILPPPTVSEDPMSVVSDDIPPEFESEQKLKPTEQIVGVPVPPLVRHPSLVPDEGESVPIREHAVAQDEDLLGLSELKPSPTKIVENIPISPPVYPSLVPEVEQEVAPITEHVVAEDEDLLGLSELISRNQSLEAVDSSRSENPSLVPYVEEIVPEADGVAPVSNVATSASEIVQGPPQSNPSPAQVLDEEALLSPPILQRLVPEVIEPTPRYKTDKTATETVQNPSEAKPQSTEFLQTTSTQKENLHPSQEFFYPPQHTPPRPSAPFEPTETDESESNLAAILSALDPSERASFLEEQNKILETIEREASNQRASSEAAWSMMVMENDEALAKRLQEEERRNTQNAVTIRGSNVTQQAMKDGKTILVECGSCRKNMHIPKGTRNMYCPVCKAVCTFENRSSKRNARGLFRLPGKNSNKAKTRR